MLLAVNGTLMRGFELNQNMHDADATFVRSARTAPVYRCWSIDDGYLGMVRDQLSGAGTRSSFGRSTPSASCRSFRKSRQACRSGTWPSKMA